jgi:predicted  nucleic acid-binding Zn-ribbon protein
MGSDDILKQLQRPRHKGTSVTGSDALLAQIQGRVKPKNSSHQAQPNVIDQAGRTINHAWDSARWWGTHPIESMGAIAGGVRRGIQGGIVGALGPHQYGHEIPDTIGSALQAISHPGAAVKINRALQHKLGFHPIPEARRAIPVAAGSDRYLQQLTKGSIDPGSADAASGAQIVGGIARGIASLATQSGVDAAVDQVTDLPVLLTKELDPAYWILRGGAKAVPFALKAAVGAEKYDELLSKLNRFHHVNRELNPAAAARVRGQSAIARQSTNQGIRRANAVVDRHQDVLQGLNSLHGSGSRVSRRQALLAHPQAREIIHELDRVSWIEGTGQVRRQMIQHGFQPPPDIAHLPEGNTLHHYDEAYFPTQKISESQRTDSGGKYIKPSKNNAGYNKRGGDGRPDDNVAEQVRQRLTQGYRNAARAEYHRNAIRTAEQGALPNVPIVERDLNSKETGNIFQPMSDAMQQAKLRDIRAGNSPSAAFRAATPSRRTVNFDITTRPGGELMKKTRISQRPAKLAEAALLEALQAQKVIDAGVSRFGLNRQKAVGKAVERENADLINQAKSRYRLLSKIDQRLVKNVKKVPGGAKDVNAHVSRNNDFGHGVIPGTPKLSSIEKIEKSLKRFNSKASQMWPEHRKGLASAREELESARADFEASKAAIYAKYPRKPGENFPDSIHDELRSARGPLAKAEEAYGLEKKRVSSEQSSFRDAKKNHPELDSKLKQAMDDVRRERAELSDRKKGKKLSPDELKSMRSQLDSAINRSSSLLKQKNAIEEALHPTQLAEIAKRTKLSAKRTVKARDAGGDFIANTWQPEYQKILSKRGERVQRTLDPLFKAHIEAEKGTRNFGNAINKTAASGSAKPVFRNTAARVEQSEKKVLREHRKLADARSTNETIDRVNDLISDELTKSGVRHIPKSVDQLLFAGESVPKVPVLADIANVFRDATFAIPYVHGWNITQQALAHGHGPATVARGMAYARRLAKGDPSLADELSELTSLGQAAEYAGHDAPAFGRIPKIGPGLAKMSNKGQETLDHIDHGIKLSVMQNLKAKGLTGPELGSKLEDVFGSPEPSYIAQLLRTVGAHFPNWRVNTLPKTIVKGIMTEPGRKALHEMDWAQNFLTQESEDPDNRKNGATPTEFNLFPAVNDVQGLVFGGPFGAMRYGLGSSITGVVPILMGIEKTSGTSALQRIAESSLPYAPVAQAMIDIYHQNPSATLEDLLAFLGPRIQKERPKAFSEKLKYAPQSYKGLSQ